MEKNLLSFEIIDLSEITKISDVLIQSLWDGCGGSNGQCLAGCGCGTNMGNCGGYQPPKLPNS